MNKKILLGIIVVAIVITAVVVWLTFFSGNEGATFLGAKTKTLTASDVEKYTRREGNELYVDKKILDQVRVKEDGEFYKYSDWISLKDNPDVGLDAPGQGYQPSQPVTAWCNVSGNPMNGGSLTCVQQGECIECSNVQYTYVPPDGSSHQGLLDIWCGCADY